MDKTIKVWEMEGLLHTVHHIDRMELGVDKLVYCGNSTNKVLAQANQFDLNVTRRYRRNGWY